METIRIPVRAMYKRAPRGCSEGWVPQMTGAVYADVPAPVLRGALGECAKDRALRAGDDEAVGIIEGALDRAEMDGVVTRMK